MTAVQSAANPETPPLPDAAPDTSAADVPIQHPCPPSDSCAYCQGAVPEGQALDWSFLDAVYCISLKSRNDRAERVAEEFHRTGLCRKVVFYRPVKHPVKGTIGSWESHRAVAGLALEQGAGTTLVFEDDVQFVRNLRPRRVRAIAQAIRDLPPDWNLFYLGHWPLWCYFVRPNVLRTASACAHAYVASPRLMAWLWDHPHSSRDGLPMMTVAGHQLDAAFAALPGCYAVFPMIATQSISRSDNFATTTRPKKKFKHIISRSSNREWFLSTFMRPAELIMALLSPISWLIQRFKR